MTPAGYLAGEQRRRPPPRPGGDRALALYRWMAPGLPADLAAWVADGRVAIGEIRRNAPDVRELPVSGGFAVVCTSGMLDFVEALVATLAGNMVKRNGPTPENEAALAVAEVALRAARLFRLWLWPRQLLWRFRPVRYPDFDMAPGVRATVERMAGFASAFLLAHELAHIALEAGLVAAPGPHPELAADETGLALLLQAGATRGTDPTLTYAGAILAVRICAGLEHVGVDFRAEYPPQAARVAQLQGAMRARCPSAQYFHEIARIAVAYAFQMDDVDAEIDGRRADHAPSTEQLLVTAIAMLLDVAQGRLRLDELEAHWRLVTARSPREAGRQALETLRAYYPGAEDAAAFIDPGMRARMGEALRALLPRLEQGAIC